MVQKACQNCLDYFLQTKEKMSADDNPYDALKNHLLAVLRKSQNKASYESVEAEKEVQVEMSAKDLAVSPGYVDIAANLLDIDFALAESIDKAHLLGVPAMAIIQRLRQGTFPY
jgi:hypothetical protein